MSPTSPVRVEPRGKIRQASRALMRRPLQEATPIELGGAFLDGLERIFAPTWTTLLILNEATFEFYVAIVRPPERRDAIDVLVAQAIEDGAFASALRRMQPTVLELDGSRGQLLLVPATSGPSTPAMGLAFLPPGAEQTSDHLAGAELLAALLAARLEGWNAGDRSTRESRERERIQDEKEKLYLDLERSIFRLHRLEQQRDDLTRMIVHDLRTPMTSIKTTLELLGQGLMGTLEADEMMMVEIAATSSDQLLGMINDLLDISKFEAGELEASVRSTDVLGVAQGAAAALGPLANLEDKSVDVICAGPDLIAWTDPDLVRRIVENLSGNALRFSPPHSRVTIALTAEVVPGMFELAVTDEGEGIPAEYLDRIFEKFVQVEGRQHGRKLGTGLGLTFCQFATEALGGSIHVESEPGRGSTFFVRLPSAKPDEAPTPAPGDDGAC